MSILVDVEPSVLKGIRERSGWKTDEMAKRLGVSVKSVSEIESGSKSPTMAQLRKMAAAFEYPVALLMMDRIPEEKPMPKDLRAGTNTSGAFDRKTILAVRRARRLQSLGLEMSENLGRSVNVKIKKAKLSDDSKAIASKYRSALGLDDKIQRSGNVYSLFKYLVSKIEDANVFVFKLTMPIEDARGFAFSDGLPAVVVVNSADSPEGRLFTLIHEFGHILLGDTSIDLPEAGRAQHEHERWCNGFASSFLLPDSAAKELFDAESRSLTSTQTLERMSKEYKVSKAFLLFKMLDLGLISKTECERVLARPAKRKDGSGKSPGRYGSWEQRRISEIGKPILYLVGDNMDAGFMTYADALFELSLNSKTFDRIMLKI